MSLPIDRISDLDRFLRGTVNEGDVLKEALGQVSGSLDELPMEQLSNFLIAVSLVDLRKVPQELADNARQREAEVRAYLGRAEAVCTSGLIGEIYRNPRIQITDSSFPPSV